MSALAKADGVDVVDLRLTMPRVGVWVAEMGLSSDVGLQEGKLVDLVVAGRTWTGTVDRSRAAYGSSVARVLGGAGKLASKARPKHYTDTSFAIVLGDLLSAGGERKAADCDSGLLAQRLDHWTVTAIPLGQQLAKLCAEFDATWRVRRDGTLWVGFESWPKTVGTGQVVGVDPLNDSQRLAIEVPDFLPGEDFEGDHLEYVQVDLLAGVFRATLWHE